MGDPVSGQVRGKVRARLHSGTRLTVYHISLHVFSTFKRLTVVFAAWSVLIEEKLGGTGIPDLFKHLRQLLRAVEEQNEYGYIYKWQRLPSAFALTSAAVEMPIESPAKRGAR